MSIMATCPACGFASPDIRCPRCNALKVQGCSGACSLCGSSCKDGESATAPDGACPSDAATSDTEHPGTLLKR